MRTVKIALLPALALALLISSCAASSSLEPPSTTTASPASSLPAIRLPEPILESEVSLEEALLNRRSVRDYSGAALSLSEISQLLWAGQGITSEAGGRTAPSAGGLYPLEIYLAVGMAERLAAGVYRYDPEGHALLQLTEEDTRTELAGAAVNQRWVGEGAVVIAITAVYERTTAKYGDRGIRYAHLEAGHAAQNICLEATALNLGAVTVGAFDDDRVGDILRATPEETPLYLIPVGKKR